MATITAHTIFSNSINLALTTGEMRTKTELLAEFDKEYQTFAFSNFEAFDLDIKTLMSKIEADVAFLSSIYKKTLMEHLLATKDQVEEVIVQLESAIIMMDANITERKAQLSDIEKYRAYIAKEEGIAKVRNIDFGMLISYIKTTAGYLSYVLTVDPLELSNTETTSPLTRFKAAKDELKAALVSYGYGGLNGSTVLDGLKTLVNGMNTSLSSQALPATVPVVTITQDTFTYLPIADSVTETKIILDTSGMAAVDLMQEVVDRYFKTYGIENKKRAETLLAVEIFQQKINKSLIEMVLNGREEIRKESIAAEAKLQGYKNEIAKKRQVLDLKYAQLAEAGAKIQAGANDIDARVAAVQNFYDNLLRQGTEITGSYANSVVSSVPAQASTVITEFKEFLDMQQKEIDVRV